MHDTLLLEEQATKIASFNGIDIYQIKTEKFKTNSINIFFHDNISTENASKNALLPAVMRRGCVKFPTFQHIALYLEELYGASFDCGVVKKGEQQIIQFYIDHISDKFTGESSSLFRKVFSLLFEIITQPLLENGAFKAEYVEQEKENLKKLIEGRANDKMQYAVDKCFEEMCKGEPFEIYEYGSVQDLGFIDGKILSEHYKYLIENLPIKVFITGNIEKSDVSEVIDKFYRMKRDKTKDIQTGITDKHVKESKNVTERMSVNQGKLSLGFRTNTSPSDENYYALMVYNGILGGGMHSKLFHNVREKESLAYYAFSRLEKFKGLMVISSGIEIQNRDKAVGIILQQLDEIKAGNISDYEYESTIKSIETGIKSLKDGQLQIVDFYLSQAIVGTNDNFETLIEKIKKVTKQNVIDVSEKIMLDTTYFLTSKGE